MSTLKLDGMCLLTSNTLQDGGLVSINDFPQNCRNIKVKVGHTSVAAKDVIWTSDSSVAAIAPPGIGTGLKLDVVVGRFGYSQDKYRKGMLDAVFSYNKPMEASVVLSNGPTMGILLHTYTRARTHARARASTHAHTRTHACIHACIPLQTFRHAYIHSYILHTYNTHTHTHTHTQARVW